MTPLERRPSVFSLLVVVALLGGCRVGAPPSATTNRPLPVPSSGGSSGELDSGAARRTPRPSPRPPVDWWLRGSNPGAYKGALVKSPGLSTVGVSLRSRRRLAAGFGSYWKRIDATPFRGKRIQLRAEVSAEGVRNWGGLWMRIDRHREPIAFDNMHDRRLRGTTDARMQTVTLDVAPDASSISYGVLLVGGGSITARRLEIVEVTDAVPARNLIEP